VISTSWFDDYEDRVIFDEAGLFEYKRVDEKTVTAGEAVQPRSRIAARGADSAA